MQNVFVYGSLLFTEITIKLTGKSFKISPAELPGYKLYCVKGSDYPAIIQQECSKTFGLVIKNVDELSLNIFSHYEANEYEKRRVTVMMNNKPKDVLTFVWAKGCDFLEEREWHLLQFQENSLEHYLNVVIPETLEDFKKG